MTPKGASPNIVIGDPLEECMKKIIFVMMFLVVAATAVWAQAKYSIKKMTPEVEAALNSRHDRFDQMRALKTAGVLGENNHGYIEVLKEQSSAKALADAENQDRQVIYKTIAEQNGLENALATIEGVFAQVQRDKADAGDQIQTEDGQWIAK